MRKLSLNQFSHPARPFQEDVELAARAGYQGVGLHRSKLEAFGVERARRLLRDAGLEAACLGAAGRLLPPERQGIEDTRRAIELAAQMGAGSLVIVTGPRGGLSYEEAAARFTSAVAELLPFAQSHGVRLALEPIAPVRAEVNFVHLLGDALDLVERARSPWLGVCLDIWYVWWERDYAQNVRRGARSIALVQISDQWADAHSMRDRAPLGRGIIPLRQTLQVIDQAGYSGFYDVECFTPRLSDEEQAALAPQCKQAFDGLWS